MALWGIPLILFLSYMGSYYFLILILIINSLSIWEYYTILENKNFHAYRVLGLFLSTLIILTAFWFSIEYILLFLLIGTVLILFRHLKITRPIPSVNTAITLSGIFYITLFLASLVILRINFSQWTGTVNNPNIAGYFFMFIWISLWLCDTLAYSAGHKLGKHKLAPQTSPNKTVEGAVAGLFGALFIYLVLGPFFLSPLSTIQLLLSGLIVGIAGQMGDLVESRFKRDAGVKDTSTLLPGHGGFLDRFDSLIFVSPFFYVIFYLMKS
jgi:phosphatidate cytidylyltransferase